MNILVTGVEGYVGTNLTKHLLATDHTVVGFDLKQGNTICSKRSIGAGMVGCDAVIHLAAMPGVPYCESHPIEASHTNVQGTINVAKAANLQRIPLVFSSTFAAKEPRNIYGITKRLGEAIVLKAGGVVLRLANVYGGEGYLERKANAVANFVNAKSKQGHVTIYGDGLQERDFIHIDDVCRAFIAALKAPSGIYEVCTGTQTTILELAKLLNVQHRFAAKRPYDVKKVPSSLEQFLPGWSPKKDLESGLQEFFG